MNARPFPIPVVAAGPGSHAEDETLEYITLPAGMHTYRPPALPEPEELAGHAGTRAVLGQVLTALRAARPARFPLDLISPADRRLLDQVLGEGEVSAQVLAQPGLREFTPEAACVRVQESVFAGVWRVRTRGDDGVLVDHVEVGAVPAALAVAAAEDGAAPRQPPEPVPARHVNLPPLLLELADQRARRQPGDPAHVINLTLLPLSPEDIAHLDHQLGTGRVLILSRGYGNCRITDTRVPHTWRVVYYNSQDAVILNTIEVGPLPAVACAAAQDLADSAERLAEVLQWIGGA